MVARGRLARGAAGGPLRLIDDGVEREVALTAVADPPERAPVELAMVCTKSFRTPRPPARGPRPRARPGRGRALVPERGGRTRRRSRRACPGAAVGGVAVYLGCQRLAPDRVVRRPSRDPATGRLRDLPGRRRRRGRRATPSPPSRRRSGCRPGSTATDEPALWTKLVANASLNTVTALGRARVGRGLRRPGGGRADARARAGGGRRRAGAAGSRSPPDAAEAYLADARRRLPRRRRLLDPLRPRGRPSAWSARPWSARSRAAATALGVPVPASRACDALLRLVDPGARIA